MDFSNDCSNIAVNESDNVVFIYPLDEKGNNALFNYTTYSNISHSTYTNIKLGIYY